MGAVYEVYLYSNTGVQLACLPKRLTLLEWSRVVNDQGSFAITLSDRLKPVDTSLFQLNGRIAIYRKPSPIYPAKLEMVGFIRGWDFETDGRGVTRYTWYGPDQNCLLADRICFPKHPYTEGAWQISMRRYIDTMMRELTEDNFGAGSSNESARDVVTANGAGLTLAVESSATATSCNVDNLLFYEYGGKNLLRALQELHEISKSYTFTPGQQVPIFFDLCMDTDTTFTFRTFPNRRGMNHRSDSGQAVHIGTRYGNLSVPRWQHDRTHEVNAGLGLLYAGSYSASSWSLDSARIGEAPLNRREAAASTGEDAGGIASQLINDGKPKPRFSGKIQDTSTCRYGLHWGLGDELTIDYLEKQYNCRVTGISATVYSGRETLEPTMEVLDT